MERTVNLDSLKEMVGDDHEVIKEMLEIFAQDVPVYLETIASSLKEDNWGAIAAAAHTLKSTVSFTGRNDLVKMAETLQYQKVKPTDEQILNLLNEFTDQVNSVLGEVEEMLQTDDY